MAPYSTKCPYCGQKHNFQGRSAGTIRKCDNCSRKFTLPEPVAVGVPLHWRHQSKAGCGCILILLLTFVFLLWLIGTNPNVPGTSISTSPGSSTKENPSTGPSAFATPTREKATPVVATQTEEQQKTNHEDKAAERLLDVAKAAKDEGVIFTARRLARDVIQKYPRSKAAREAEALLKEWEK